MSPRRKASSPQRQRNDNDLTPTKLWSGGRKSNTGSLLFNALSHHHCIIYKLELSTRQCCQALIEHFQSFISLQRRTSVTNPLLPYKVRFPVNMTIKLFSIVFFSHHLEVPRVASFAVAYSHYLFHEHLRARPQNVK